MAGGVAVTRRPYRLIDAADRPHPRRFAFGVPTESVHWVTAAGIRPGVNSVILGDADAIARSCLQPLARRGSRRHLTRLAHDLTRGQRDRLRNSGARMGGDGSG